MYSERGRPWAWLALAGAVLVTGCATPEHSPQIAYREAQSERNLEVPPDLTRPESATAMRIPGVDGDLGLLPDFDGIAFVRAGNVEWLEFAGTSPEALWPRMGSFLRTQGLVIEREARELGIMETGWAERRDGPDRGGLAGLLDGLFGGRGTSIQDRYQIRLERMPDDSGTRVFLAHWTAVEEPEGTQAQRAEARVYLRRGGGDPAVRAEMVQRLLVHLGVGEAQARSMLAEGAAREAFTAAVHYREDEGDAVIPGGDFERTWARAGDGLERMGVELLDIDRAAQRYRGQWVPPGREGRRGILGIGRRAAEVHQFELHIEQHSDAVRMRVVESDRDEAADRSVMQFLVAVLGGDLDVDLSALERTDERRERGSGPTPVRQRGY